MAATQRERRKMGARDQSEQERPVTGATSTVTTPSPIRSSPYMKRSVLQAAAHKTAPYRQSAPIARKAKSPAKFPSSAPAPGIRSPAGGASALKPLKAKRGASIGISGERDITSLKEPQMNRTTPYVLIPVRLKRTELKLLDPEKVKNLTSATRVPASGIGDVKRNIILHPTTVNKQLPWSCKPSTLPRSSVKQTESSLKRMEYTSRRENMNQSGRVKSLLMSDKSTGGHQLSHLMNQLLLDDQDCDESRKSDNGQVNSGLPQTARPGDGPHDARNSGVTVQDDGHGLDKCNVQDNPKSHHLTDIPATSGQIEETEDHDIQQDTGTLVMESSHPQAGDVQQQLPGEDMEKVVKKPPCNGVENQSHTGDSCTDHTLPRCPDINMADGLYMTSSKAEPNTEAPSQEKPQSHRSHPKDNGTSEDTSHPVSPLSQKKSLTTSVVTQSNPPEDNTNLGTNLPPDERNLKDPRNQKEVEQHVWSRTDVIRQSQGVLILTRSTDENAVFIPKLMFEFTPENSVDWTLQGPTPLDSSKEGATRGNVPRILNACTPRGPTFSKSVLKKSFMLSGQDLSGGFSESALRLSSAGDVTRNGSRPLDRIVDISISFQGKYEEQEIPADIPKILLTEEDDDDDD